MVLRRRVSDGRPWLGGALLIAVALVVASCGSDGSSAFDAATSDGARVGDDPASDTTTSGDEATAADDDAATADEPTATPVPTATPGPTPTPTPQPTPTPAPPTPTPTPVPIDPISLIGRGDCVTGVDAGEDLVEVPCADPTAEGIVVTAATSSDVDCDTPISRSFESVAADGTRTEFGFCIDRLAAPPSEAFPESAECDRQRPSALDRAEVAANVCRGRNLTARYVQLAPGTRTATYLERFDWRRGDPQAVGQWRADERTECGRVFIGRIGPRRIQVFTFAEADYVVWFSSDSLSASELDRRAEFTFLTSLCRPDS